MTALATDIAPVKPLESKELIWWMGFTLDMDDGEAEAKFVAKHGHQPRVFLRDDAILKVGPIDADLER